MWAERPHLSGARGVGQILQDDFDFELGIAITGVLHISVGRFFMQFTYLG